MRNDIYARIHRALSATGDQDELDAISDKIELALMRNGEHKVARDFCLYRDALEASALDGARWVINASGKRVGARVRFGPCPVLRRFNGPAS